MPVGPVHVVRAVRVPAAESLVKGIASLRYGRLEDEGNVVERVFGDVSQVGQRRGPDGSQPLLLTQQLFRGHDQRPDARAGLCPARFRRPSSRPALRTAGRPRPPLGAVAEVRLQVAVRGAPPLGTARTRGVPALGRASPRAGRVPPVALFEARVLRLVQDVVGAPGAAALQARPRLVGTLAQAVSAVGQPLATLGLAPQPRPLVAGQLALAVVRLLVSDFPAEFRVSVGAAEAPLVAARAAVSLVAGLQAGGSSVARGHLEVPASLHDLLGLPARPVGPPVVPPLAAVADLAAVAVSALLPPVPRVPPLVPAAVLLGPRLSLAAPSVPLLLRAAPVAPPSVGAPLLALAAPPTPALAADALPRHALVYAVVPTRCPPPGVADGGAGHLVGRPAPTFVSRHQVPLPPAVRTAGGGLGRSEDFPRAGLSAGRWAAGGRKAAGRGGVGRGAGGLVCD